VDYDFCVAKPSLHGNKMNVAQVFGFEDFIGTIAKIFLHLFFYLAIRMSIYGFMFQSIY
jgi:hypothetical protein